MLIVDILDFVVVFLTGSLVAMGELTSRYKDNPTKALLSWPAALYVVVNGGGSIVALAIIRAFGWDFGVGDGQIRIIRVLIAGFGAVALFRTSLFNITVGNQIIGVGPSVLLNVILGAADRAVDRRRALDRSRTVANIMKDVSFGKSADSLKLFSFGLMQNVTAAEEETLAAIISKLRDPLNEDVPDSVKSYIFGLALLSLVGSQVLTDAVQQLHPFISKDSRVGPEAPLTPPAEP